MPEKPGENLLYEIRRAMMANKPILREV